MISRRLDPLPGFLSVFSFGEKEVGGGGPLTFILSLAPARNGILGHLNAGVSSRGNVLFVPRVASTRRSRVAE